MLPAERDIASTDFPLWPAIRRCHRPRVGKIVPYIGSCLRRPSSSSRPMMPTWKKPWKARLCARCQDVGVLLPECEVRRMAGMRRARTSGRAIVRTLAGGDYAFLNDDRGFLILRCSSANNAMTARRASFSMTTSSFARPGTLDLVKCWQTTRRFEVRNVTAGGNISSSERGHRLQAQRHNSPCRTARSTVN